MLADEAQEIGTIGQMHDNFEFDLDPATNDQMYVDSLMGIIGKLLVVVMAWYHALAGTGPLNFALLTLADLAFALFFLRYYLLSRAS